MRYEKKQDAVLLVVVKVQEQNELELDIGV